MIWRYLSLFLVLALTLAHVTPAVGAPKKATVTRSAVRSASPAPKAEPAEPFTFDHDGSAPAIRAASAIVVDANTGAILHDLNADRPRPVASTQKLLTALIVAEAGDLDAAVRVAASDTWAEPSKLYIKPGEVYSRRDLLRMLLVKSMNDVARALARDNAGTVEAFAAKMNSRAQQLGMTSSNFLNPNGLPAPGQFSTARDMARVALAAYRNRTIREFVSLKTTNWRYPNGRVKEFSNTNRVLKNFAFCNGMKTGYTEASGFCLISSASNGGRDVIVVVLGDGRESIWVDSYRLLAWGLSS